MISVLLTPTSLNHLQATYTDLRKAMMASMSRLKRSEEKPHSDSVRWHESILLLFFSALQGISCAKSSLIVVSNKSSWNLKISIFQMMGSRPSIFEFFSTELPLTEYWLASDHPDVYHLLVTILVGHLKAWGSKWNIFKSFSFFIFSHDFYIAQSDYLVRGDNSIGQSIGQTKREYARKQVIALQKIIANFGDKLLKRTR